MTNFPEIKSAIDRQMEAFDAFKKAADAREAALRERVEAIEAKATLPGATASRNSIEFEHKQRFVSWLRKPRDSKAIADLGEIQDRIISERKDMSIGSNADGGFAVPTEIVKDIERLELKLSPVRRLVKVMQAGTSDFHHLVSIGGTESGWSSETGTRSATGSPQLRDVAPTHGELYAYPVVSNWALDDVFFDLAGFLADEVAQQFAFQEGDAVINGSGVNRPTGMLNTDPALTADDASPERDQDTYEYVVSDTDVDASPAAPGVRADSLIDLVYTLNSAYRTGATWVMNSATAGAVRKLKDQNGRYLWGDSLVTGQPPSLLGYPVETWEQMPDVAAGAFPVAFGNFQRGYLLMERLGLRITRDEVTTPGLTKFYFRRREGGRPLNNDAIKFLRTID